MIGITYKSKIRLVQPAGITIFHFGEKTRLISQQCSRKIK